MATQTHNVAGQPAGKLIEPSVEALKARIAELEARQYSGTGIKIGNKGGVSMYGLGRFPVTLYSSQWESLIARIPELKTFLEVNKGKYSEKPPE